ncbi:MAG TPA: ATP synthase F1 subunit epsilon [Candidatus Acetatifactor stercoripullorum]|uniref:ATP synthase epsilon chain n=1 Tax=Candidatus Acetatifactor stercoripullorum TaxID=2838414 RepID=A0A9D1R6Z0_9FIRM|nr:ATP synthase F1 subunit epsilon [Candidatus Acetatifactor stercoripullorum]HIW81161.1 ATP synthase F1 subunit epsilon [Candidatus Acetatifactor stercoripullorum]
MNTFNLKIIASDKVFYSGKCGIIVVPALDGEIAIMSHHEDMVIATKEGEVRFKEKEEEDYRRAVVGIGFVHIANNRVTMLVDTAERPEDIDRVRAEQALERAKEQLRQKQSIQEYHVSQASLARAILRLKEAGKYEVK